MAILEKLCIIIEGHGFATRRSEDAVTIIDGEITFRPSISGGNTFPDMVTVRFDLHVTSPKLEGRTLWVCYGGLGKTDDAAENDAAYKFMLSTFHVLLAVLNGHRCQNDGIESAERNGAIGRWTLYDGPLLTVGEANPRDVPFGAVSENLMEALCAEAGPGLHWVEAFYAMQAGQRTGIEVKLDNEIWPTGQAIIEAWNYKGPETFVSGRYFLMAEPAQPASQAQP